MTDIQPSQQVSNDPPQTIGTRKDLGRLLVIDDDPSICILIEKLGEKNGFIATRAVSLEDARETVRAHHFDCITLDLGIGKSSGVEVLNILADMACTTPIIIISGSMRSMRDFAVDIGKTMQLNLEQLPKPIDFAVLRAKLSNIKAKLDLERQTEAGV
jgi:DNA-binding response OmpR family regulator